MKKKRDLKDQNIRLNGPKQDILDRTEGNHVEEVEAEYVEFEAGDQVQVEWVVEDDEDDDLLEAEFGQKSDKGRISGKRLPAEVRCFDTARILVKGGAGGRVVWRFGGRNLFPKVDHLVGMVETEDLYSWKRTSH